MGTILNDTDRDTASRAYRRSVPPRGMLTREQVAELCGVTTKTVDRWTNGNPERGTPPLDGFPRPLRIGHRNLWKRSDIEQYLSTGEPNDGPTDTGEHARA